MQSQREFFAAVLADAGLPCVGKLVKGRNNKFFQHEVFDTVEKMCDMLDKADFTACDYYFCISTLHEKSVRSGTGDNAKERTRVTSNTALTRCLVLDVDIRPDKADHYSSLDEGWDGIQTVVESLGLPQPIIVNSGFGYHVYWPMLEGIESGEWRKIARAFKKAVELVAPEVVADGSRVADSAGVLRIPGSYNLKSDPPTPVIIEQWFSDYLDLGVLKTRLHITADDAKVTTGIDVAKVDSEPAPLSKVVSNCNWMAQYLKNSAEASEPEWYAMLGLVPYLIHEVNGVTVSGPELAHAFSKKHPDYNPEHTYNKYMQAKAGATGPSTCARLQSINSSRCEGCPFRATVKTPIGTKNLDRPATKEETVTTFSRDSMGNKQEETVTIPLPPKPYFRGEKGGVYVRQKKQADDGSWDEVINKVYDYDIYPVRRFRTETLESEQTEICLWLPKDGLRKFKLPSGLLADGKALAKFLSDKGVVVEYGTNAGVTKFLTDYVRYMQSAAAAEIEFSRFGWREIYGVNPKFVVGDGYITKDGTHHPSTVADFLKAAKSTVTAKGSLEQWKEGFKVYKDVPDSNPYILASLLGFAAPLMAMTEYNGVLYNMVGHSAAGKSTALKVMTSVWGEPQETHILPKDTEIAAFNFIGYLNSVPVAFDELTKMDGDRLSDFCLNFTSGRGKMRAGRDGANRNNDVTWDTIVCATSNTSLYDKLAANRRGYNAEAMRIFELSVGESSARYKEHIDRHISLLRGNYGEAGRIYIKYVLDNVDKIKALVEKAMSDVIRLGNLRNEERFWGALLACVLVGGKIAKDVLDLHDYDVTALVRWALGVSEEVRTAVAATVSSPVSTIAEFLNNNLDSTLRMEGDRPMLSGMQTNIRSVRARIEYESGVPYSAFISTAAIREYCQKHNIDPSWLRKGLIDEGVMLNSNKQCRITANSGLPVVNLKVWEIDMKHPALVGVVQEVLQEPDVS